MEKNQNFSLIQVSFRKRKVTEGIICRIDVQAISQTGLATTKVKRFFNSTQILTGMGGKSKASSEEFTKSMSSVKTRKARSSRVGSSSMLTQCVCGGTEPDNRHRDAQDSR